jgi:hypothetical protein
VKLVLAAGFPPALATLSTEARKLDAILDIRRLTEGGFVEGVSAGG